MCFCCLSSVISFGFSYFSFLTSYSLHFACVPPFSILDVCNVIFPNHLLSLFLLILTCISVLSQLLHKPQPLPLRHRKNNWHSAGPRQSFFHLYVRKQCWVNMEVGDVKRKTSGLDVSDYLKHFFSPVTR